jgi:putative oxidoreductase
MTLPHYSRAYETWAPFLARLIFGFQFLLGALFKITWHGAEVAQTAAAGVPFPELAVWLAFVLEVVAGIALIIGFKVRTTALVLALYVLLLTFIFYRNVADPMVMGMFVSHLAFVAAFLYLSVYGAQRIAVRKDPLPLP